MVVRPEEIHGGEPSAASSTEYPFSKHARDGHTKRLLVLDEQNGNHRALGRGN